jgi:hypothetical protein
MPWGAVAAAGVGAGLNMIGAKKANRARRAARDASRIVLTRLQGITDRSYAGQNDLLQRGIGDLIGGYDKAQSEIGRVGRASKRQAIDSETQQRGQLGTQLSNAGLQGSSIAMNAQRGLAAQTQRRMQEIDAMLAGLYGDIATNRGQALFGGAQAMQQLAGNQLASDTAIQNARYGLVAGQEMAPPPSYSLGGLGSFLSSLGGNSEDPLGGG